MNCDSMNQDDAWLVLDNKVYDVTSVLSWHPGRSPDTKLHGDADQYLHLRWRKVYPDVRRESYRRRYERGERDVQTFPRQSIH